MKADANQRVIGSLEALPAWIGMEVACSDWLAVDQQRILQFAEATGDRQWIHTDPERALSESPYRSTIAHGYLTLSLLPHLLESCLRIDGVGMAINYGLDRVRFPAALLVGGRVRARLTLERLESVVGGVQAHWAATVELERSDKPACVAQMLVRYYSLSTSA
jgi:acyl dehydratase